MGIESSEHSSLENEQTPEEIRSVLETALEQGRHVDLVINSLAGEPVPTPDLIVEEFEGDNLMMTYLAEDGDVGELIPLEFARVKRAELR
jgi:hypothetical protein